MKDFLYRLGQTVGLFPVNLITDKKEQKTVIPPSVTPTAKPDAAESSSLPNQNGMDDLLKTAEQYIQPVKTFYAENQDTVHYCSAGGLALGALYHSKVARTGLGIAGLLLAYSVGSQKLQKLNELEKKNRQDQNNREEEADKKMGKPKP